MTLLKLSKGDLEQGERSRLMSYHGNNGKVMSQGSGMPNMNYLQYHQHFKRYDPG